MARTTRTFCALTLAFLLSMPPASWALAGLRVAAQPEVESVLAEGWDVADVGVDVYSPDTVELAGSTRIETAVAVSAFGWPQSDSVVIATAWQFPDALVGGPLATLLGAPILLTQPGSLPPVVADEIRRLGATSAIVLGGTGAVTQGVIDDLVELGISRTEVVRIGGTDRYDTARLVAHRICDVTGTGGRVAVAVGTNYPDALSVSALAGRLGMPILLTPGATLSPASAEVIGTYAISEALVVGGVGAVSVAVEGQLPDPVRIGGADRYETATLLGEYATRFGLGYEDIFVATGADFPDALAVGPLAAKMSGTLVLATRDAVPAATGAFIASHCSSIKMIHYVGGTGVVGPATRAAIEAASETRISRAVEVADPATESALDTITPDGTMVFDSGTPLVLGLQPGSILAAGGTPDGATGSSGAPDGYLRRVVSAPQSAGGKVTVETEEVSLEEVFEQGSIDFSEPVEAIDEVQTLAVAGGEIVTLSGVSALATGLDIGFDITESYEFQLASGSDNLEAGVTATGLLHVAGGAYLNVSIKSWTLNTFATGVYGAEDLDLEVNAWLTAAVERERELFSRRIARTRFSVGPVPVQIDFILSGKVGFEAAGEVGFLAGVSQGASFRYGYSYQRGDYGDTGDGWTQIRERSFEWSRTGPEIWADCEARAYGRVQLDVMFYGIGGPYVGVDVGLEFEASTPVFSAEIPPEPPGSTAGYTCDLNAFVDLVPGVAVRFKVWKFTVLQVSKEWPIRLVTWDLYEQNPPAVPPGDAPSLKALIPRDTSTVDLLFDTVAGHDLTVVPSKFHITAGESPGGLPLTITDVSCLGEGHVRIRTAVQTQECYWIQCEQGAVTDFAARPNILIDTPYMAAYPVHLTAIATDVGWGPPTPDISGFDGESRFVVWRDHPGSVMNIGWYDLATSGRGTTVCPKTPLDLNASGNTAVWSYEAWPEVYPSEVWMQTLPAGSSSLYAPGMLKPQLAGGWLMYETEEFPPKLAADGPTVTVFVSSDARDLKEWTLSDGLACLVFLDGSIDVVDLTTGVRRHLITGPRNTSNARIDDDRVVCLEDGQRILVFDLSEAAPAARELPDPTAAWDRFELYGTSIIAYDATSGLWASDLVKDPVRWKPLVLPAGYMFDDFDVYGPDIVGSIALPTEELNIYLIRPQ
ncbi:MAG: cell wall-binding repeat-containing protein [Coriobacteriia bacterium]|nr:cell wall-binding repeat-containing protein [Coriobacteriia bacterium]